MSLRPKIEMLFSEVIENLEFNEKVFAEFFSPDYIQHVDGKTLNYEALLKHMQVQKEALKEARVTLESFIEQGDKCSTIHRVDAKLKEGREIQMKVIAHFTFSDGKIIECDELTHLIQGDDQDRDLGSRTD